MPDSKTVLDPVVRKIFAADAEYQAFQAAPTPELPDFIFATAADERRPDQIFPRIRWGGQFVFADESLDAVKRTAKAFSDYGFHLDKPPGSVPDGWKFFPFLRRKVHFFSARKILHVPKGGVTNRFTFEVQLSVQRETHKGQHVVTKRIPSVEWVANRLKHQNSDADMGELEKRAGALIRNILPIFLTREVQIMKRLQERVPKEYRHRIPYTVRFEKDARGLVTLLQVNWLRNGGAPLSQLEFALQSMELLSIIHDKAGVAHLDLRLDNMVIIPDGVGFIDFGNSVHDDEDIGNTPMLQKVFGDLMRTTQVQRGLARAIQTGHVTAPYLKHAVYKVDKAVDLFYLVYQFTNPHENPDLRDLILYEQGSAEDEELKKLTRRLFCPPESEMNRVYNAATVAAALRALKKRMVG